MRRVAEALGVGTMTLYGYFRDKDELLAAVIDAAVGDERPTLPVPGASNCVSWSESPMRT